MDTPIYPLPWGQAGPSYTALNDKAEQNTTQLHKETQSTESQTPPRNQAGENKWKQGEPEEKAKEEGKESACYLTIIQHDRTQWW